MSRVRRNGGFSMVELMIALAIIGIMSAAIAPTISEMVADNRQATAAIEIVRLSRKARAAALASGTAYALHYDKGTGELGRLTLWAGMNGRCLQTAWPYAPGSVNSTLPPVDALSGDMYWFNPKTPMNPTKSDSDRQVIYLDALLDGNEQVDAQICYQPDGEIYTAVGVGTALTREDPLKPMLFRVYRSLNGTSRGEVREIVFPAGGTARAR
jgi:prepilin-type N-terminal cleavage/methylation domain-containing protein